MPAPIATPGLFTVECRATSLNREDVLKSVNVRFVSRQISEQERLPAGYPVSGKSSEHAQGEKHLG
jgi:hypothetical protein